MSLFEKQPYADEALDAKAEPKLIEETPIVDQKKRGVFGEILSQEAINRFDKEVREKVLDNDSVFDRPIQSPTPPRAD